MAGFHFSVRPRIPGRITQLSDSLFDKATTAAVSSIEHLKSLLIKFPNVKNYSITESVSMKLFQFLFFGIGAANEGDIERQRGGERTRAKNLFCWNWIIGRHFQLHSLLNRTDINRWRRLEILHREAGVLRAQLYGKIQSFFSVRSDCLCAACCAQDDIDWKLWMEDDTSDGSDGKW